ALKDYPSHDRKGFNLARKVHRDRPGLRIFGVTALADSITGECENWFQTVGDPITGIGVYQKDRQWVLLRHRVFKLTGQPSPVKVFIVHGHNHKIRDELGDYAKKLKWKVEVLAEGLSSGRTWIELFEKQVEQASLAWILFTSDEW